MLLLVVLVGSSLISCASAAVVEIQEPQQVVYESNSISVVFSYELPNLGDQAEVKLGEFSYVLDGVEVGFTPSSTDSECRVRILGLTEGNHTLSMRVSYYTSNTNPIDYSIAEKVTMSSTMVKFAINAAAPKVQVLSIDNFESFNGTQIPLVFSISEPAAWMGYSIDDQETVTISGNTTLTIPSEGVHSLVVYARDVFGSEGNQTVYLKVVSSQSTATPDTTTTTTTAPATTTQSSSTPTSTSAEPAEGTSTIESILYFVAGMVVGAVLLGITMQVRKRASPKP